MYFVIVPSAKLLMAIMKMKYCISVSSIRDIQISRNVDYKTLAEVYLHRPDIDKRAALDQGFRDYLLLLLGQSQPLVVWQSFLTRCVEACRQEMATVTMPIVMLGDIFDCLTLDQCQQLFTFVEDNVAIWKEDLFFTACKNNLLRMCNGK